MATGAAKTIAELRTFAPGAYSSVIVACRDTPGDGGDGTFVWTDVGEAALQEDDGGVIVMPGTMAKATPGRWLRDFTGPISVRWYGAKGDGKTVDTAAIQNADDSAAKLPVPVLFFPTGVYVIDAPDANRFPQDPDFQAQKRYGILKHPESSWLGEGADRSVLKLADGAVTATCDPQMVYACRRIERVSFTALGFDLNGDENTVDASELSREALLNVAAIWFNGVNLQLHGLVIERCTFANGPGSTVIVVANVNDSTDGVFPLSEVTIRNNHFVDNRNRLTADERNEKNEVVQVASFDHSTINCWAEYTTIANNTFEQTVKDGRAIGATCMEFHASHGTFAGNVITSYGRVVLASQNFRSRWSDLRVIGNDATDLGMNFVSTSVDKAFFDSSFDATRPDSSWRQYPIELIVVRGNRAWFNTRHDHNNGGSKTGVFLDHWGEITAIEVRSNEFGLDGRSGELEPYGIAAPDHGGGSTPPAGRVLLMRIVGNDFVGFYIGARFDNVGRRVAVHQIEFLDNRCIRMHDPRPDGHAAGIHLGPGTFQSVEILDNQFLNDTLDTIYRDGVWTGDPQWATAGPPLLTPTLTKMRTENWYMNVPYP